MTKKTANSRNVSFRLPPEEFERLELEAQKAGVSPGLFVKELVAKRLDCAGGDPLAELLPAIRAVGDSLLEHRRQFATTIPLLLFDAGNVADHERDAVERWVSEHLASPDPR